tara:strand:- start:144 stop:1451 length:1308 start_codon:yes stop_codon:yes gene_type:complete
MAKFYYVKSGYGTNVGATPFTTKQTGAFSTLAAASCYDSLSDITGQTAGDFILISHLHNKVYATATSYTLHTGYGYIHTMSVDDNSCDNYTRGAKEEVTSGDLTYADNSLRAHYTICGVSFKSVNGSVNGNGYHSLEVLYECTFIAAVDIDLGGSSKYVKLTNCDLSGQRISASNTKFEMYGGTVSNTAYITASTAASWFYDVDMSGSSPSIQLLGGISVAGTSKITFTRCTLPTTYQIYQPATYDYLFTIDIIGCDNYYSFGSYAKYSEMASTTSLYLNYTYDGTSKLAVAINSLTEISNVNPVQYKLCELPAQDLSVTDKTYRVNLLLDTDTVATLSDSDFWIEVSHNDNTSLALGKIVSSRSVDILAVGTELTTSVDVWQGTLPTNTKAYQVDITLSAASLPNVTNGNVVVYVNLAVPNADVYVCPAVQIGV